VSERCADAVCRDFRKVDQLRDVSAWPCATGWVDAELGKKGRFHERNQHFHWSAYRAVHDPATPRDAQGESTGRGFGITKDVPELRTDHLSAKGSLLGVWQALYES
jgi:hypothetical protein